MTEQMICSVCCDPYTKETRRPIACAVCSYEACTRCVKAFLLGTPEPNCMNCHHVWNREFLDQHLTRSWREGELKEHRGALLFDRERSLLPATQEAVMVELQKRAYGAELPELCASVSDLKGQLATLQAEVDRRHYFIRHGRHPGPQKEKEEKERRQFIAACPSDCRGFLSTAYKCGTCQTQFCSACREPRTADTDTHECDPALVATIQAIVKNSRPCPACGMAISKVDGCDQMYCTACDTPYSYETGKVVTGVIHNPHYFERMRALKGTIPRVQGDTQGDNPGCNVWPVFHQLPQKVRIDAFLREIYRFARHMEQVGLNEYPTHATPTDNTDLRVRYLLKELTEARFKQLVQQRDRKRQKELEIRAPLELFVVTSLEFFLDKPTPEKAEAFKAQIETLVNAPLRAIGERYANQVPQINLESGGVMQWKK